LDIYCSILGGGDYIIIEILSSFQAKEIFEFTPKEGISVFTIAYLQVQFIERIIELFSGAKVFKEQRRDRKCKSRKCGGYCGGYIGEIIS
jgi:hypothetical protein